jgi:hypothetical protein
MNEAQLIEAVSRIEGVLDVQYPHGEASAVKLLDGRTAVSLLVYIEAPEPEENALGVHVKESIKVKAKFNPGG